MAVDTLSARIGLEAAPTFSLGVGRGDRRRRHDPDARLPCGACRRRGRLHRHRRRRARAGCRSACGQSPCLLRTKTSHRGHSLRPVVWLMLMIRVLVSGSWRSGVLTDARGARDRAASACCGACFSACGERSADQRAVVPGLHAGAAGVPCCRAVAADDARRIRPSRSRRSRGARARRSTSDRGRAAVRPSISACGTVMSTNFWRSSSLVSRLMRQRIDCSVFGDSLSGGPNIISDGHHQRFSASCAIAFCSAVPSREHHQRSRSPGAGGRTLPCRCGPSRARTGRTTCSGTAAPGS